LNKRFNLYLKRENSIFILKIVKSISLAHNALRITCKSGNEPEGVMDRFCQVNSLDGIRSAMARREASEPSKQSTRRNYRWDFIVNYDAPLVFVNVQR